METPYLCPSCGTNRSRFHVIEQVVQSVRKDPKTGEIVGSISPDDPLYIPYSGEKVRVQCGVCGLIESELRFIKAAERNRLM
jgi:rubredoxin